MKQNPPNLGIDHDPVRHPEGCQPGLDCDQWLIENAQIYHSESDQFQSGSVLLADGNIQAVGTIDSAASAQIPDAQRLDAQGQWLIPGLVDGWARLREPGAEHKATIATESAAAVASGITTLCVPPDTDPILDTVAVARFIKRRAQLAGRARVVCIGAMSQQLEGMLLSEMAALHEGGCVAISNADAAFADLALLRRALEYGATFDLTLVLTVNDASLSRRGCAHEGMVATRLGLPGIPISAETAPLAQLIALLEDTPARVHINQVSCAASVALIRAAQQRGIPITAGVSIHHLWLTQMDIDALDPNTHVIPPLRTERDRSALRQGLIDGVLNSIISDHQPHEPDAKLAPFAETQPGISGLNSLLPLALKLVEDEILPLGVVMAALTTHPANHYGLDNTGVIRSGYRADLTLVDPDAMYQIIETPYFSAGENSPFLGWDFAHQVDKTWVNGKLVFNRQQHATGHL